MFILFIWSLFWQHRAQRSMIMKMNENRVSGWRIRIKDRILTNWFIADISHYRHYAAVAYSFLAVVLFSTCLPIMAILSQVDALFCVLFTSLDNAVAYQNWQISGMPTIAICIFCPLHPHQNCLRTDLTNNFSLKTFIINMDLGWAVKPHTF